MEEEEEEEEEEADDDGGGGGEWSSKRVWLRAAGVGWGRNDEGDEGEERKELAYFHAGSPCPV